MLSETTEGNASALQDIVPTMNIFFTAKKQQQQAPSQNLGTV
jgi:hypothetical protein